MRRSNLRFDILDGNARRLERDQPGLRSLELRLQDRLLLGGTFQCLGDLRSECLDPRIGRLDERVDGGADASGGPTSSDDADHKKVEALDRLATEAMLATLVSIQKGAEGPPSSSWGCSRFFPMPCSVHAP
mgnify:CR=1 FL=1